MESAAKLQPIIEEAYAHPDLAGEKAVRSAVEETMALLDIGKLRVAERISGEWVVNGWVQMAILLYFRHRDAEPSVAGPMSFRDKIPIKSNLTEQGVRVVPP